MSFLLALSLLVLASANAQQSELMPNYFNHPCVRPCQDEAEPMECQYRFVVESYQTMSRACYDCAKGNVTDCLRQHCVTANGFSRNIKTVNRGIPGPTIQVCEGDTIIVDLENYMFLSEGVTIHWHGILQRLSPHMDGVGMITQCPIQAFTTFQYKFVAIDPGTHFWHAHTGLQRGEGVFGSLVVRQAPSREPHNGLYVFDLPEHVLVVNEWQNRPLIDIYTASNHASGSQRADAVLINGRDIDPTGTLTLPRTEFEVEPEQKYRFRVINSGSLFCPIQISIDNHTLTLIASDGRAFDPLEVQSFDVYSAERYDFVITTNQPAGEYWFRAKGLGSCQSSGLEGRAILRYLTGDKKQHGRQGEKLTAYEEPPLTDGPEITGMMFNSISVENDQPLFGDTRDQIIGMNASYPDDRSLTGEPDHQFILEFQMRPVNNLHYFDPDLYPANSGPYSTLFSAQINRISNHLGPVSLLSQMHQIPPEMFCNVSSVGSRCETEWCECIHKLSVKQEDVVEIVLISPSGSGFTHPIHLHGFSYRVVAMDRVPEVLSAELFREMDARGEIKRKLSRAPFKDTTPVPNGGYVILRFVADNPGVWFFHCHLAFHAEIGMSLSLEVLQPDGTLPPPPEGFPACGPFVAPPEKTRKNNKESSLQTTSPDTDDDLWTRPGALDLVRRSPKWLFSALLTTGLVLVVLLGCVITLWKRTRRAEKEMRRLQCPPAYRASGWDSSPHDDFADHSSGNHYSYSKKQERQPLNS